MKRIIFCLLILSMTLFSCTPTPPTTDLKEYTKIEQDAISLYEEALEKLTSGEIKLKYTNNKSVKSTTVNFSPTQDGETEILAEIKYTDGGYVTNYFDGENLFVIVDGKGRQMESEYIESDAIYENLLGLPEEYTTYEEDFIAYKKNDGAGYLVLGEIEYDTGDESVEKITVYFNMNADKMPEDYKILFYKKDVDGKENTEYITGVYTKLGEEIKIQKPQYEQVQE